MLNRKKIELLFIILSIILIGCGDEHKRDIKPTKLLNTPPKIEVIEGNGTKKIKVEIKEDNNSVTKSKNSNSFYYEKNGANEKESHRTALDAYTHIRSPYERVQVSLLVTQLSLNFKLKCSACHDDYANGVVGPSLLGRDENYIYSKIIEFKTGKKDNPLMKELLEKISNDEIKGIAKEIYEFNIQVQKMRREK